MTKAELVKAIAAQTGVEAVTVATVVEQMMEEIRQSMIGGENVYLRGFGSFILKHRAQTVSYTHLDVYKRQAYFQRIALGVVAVEGRHGGDDEGEEAGFDERIDDRIEFEIVEQSRDVVVGDHDAREDGDHPAAGDADQNAQDRQERKEEHRSRCV